MHITESTFLPYGIAQTRPPFLIGSARPRRLMLNGSWRALLSPGTVVVAYDFARSRHPPNEKCSRPRLDRYLNEYKCST